MTSRIKGPGPNRETGTSAGQGGGREAQALINVIVQAASERGHTFVETARSLDITDVYLGRLRRRPELLRRCDRSLLERIAVYVGWPLLNVYVASGILPWSEVSEALHSKHVMKDALGQLVRSPLGAAVRTPLDAAAADHQILIALLFLSAQQAEIWKRVQLP